MESISKIKKIQIFNCTPYSESTASNINIISTKKTLNDNFDYDEKNFEDKIINIKLKKIKKLNVNNIEYKTISYLNENNIQFNFKLFKEDDMKLEKFILNEIKKYDNYNIIAKEEEDYSTDENSFKYGDKKIKEDLEDGIKIIKKFGFNEIRNYRKYIIE